MIILKKKAAESGRLAKRSGHKEAGRGRHLRSGDFCLGLLAVVCLAWVPVRAERVSFAFTSNQHTRDGLVSVAGDIPSDTASFTFIYDVSDQSIGSISSVEIAVSSTSGRSLTTGGNNGLTVDGGDYYVWLDYGEYLDFRVTLKDSGSTDITADYSINVVSAEIRSSPSGALVFRNGTDKVTLFSTATGAPMPEVLAVATQGADRRFSVSRNYADVAFQLNDIELELLLGGVQTATLSGTSLMEDTYLRGPNNVASFPKNYGGQDKLIVGRGINATDEANGLIRFPDLTSAANQSITRAVLRLYDFNIGTQTMDVDIHAYEVAAANDGWVEGSSSDATETGASCWRFQTYNSTNWAGGQNGCGISGTDYTTNLVATATSVDGVADWVEFELEPAVVQKWIDTPSENHGLVLISQGAGDAGEVVFFRSSEYADATYYPQLVLEWQVE
jgi:hypothetical protein